MRFRTLPTLLAGLFVLAACSAPAPHTPPPPAVLVRSFAAANAPPSVQVYAGEVRARIESDLGFRIGGKLVERLVDVGAEVAAGTPLALLDAQDVRLALASAQAAAAAAESDLALARTEFARARELQARNFVSSSLLDARRTALQAAEARLRQARAQAEVAAEQVAQQRIRIAQRRCQPVKRAGARRLRPVEQAVFEAVMQRPERGEGVGQVGSSGDGRRKRCMAPRRRQAATHPTGREDAGRRARPDQKADPLASLGNDLPQTGHVLVWIVGTDRHRALPFLAQLMATFAFGFFLLHFTLYSSPKRIQTCQ